MTPIEKADELVDKFDIGEQLPYYSIKHALIAVDEIIDSLQIKNYSQADQYEYWNEVKHEIENL